LVVYIIVSVMAGHTNVRDWSELGSSSFQ